MRVGVYADNGEHMGVVQAYGHPTTDQLIQQANEKFGKEAWHDLHKHNDHETYTGLSED